MVSFVDELSCMTTAHPSVLLLLKGLCHEMNNFLKVLYKNKKVSTFLMSDEYFHNFWLSFVKTVQL
jgi:hypothetical protein